MGVIVLFLYLAVRVLVGAVFGVACVWCPGLPEEGARQASLIVTSSSWIWDCDCS